MATIYADDTFERTLWQKDIEYIMGIDEVGRGAWAGPVVIGAVIFPKNTTLDFQLADSKLLTKKKRQALATRIQACALHTAVISIEVEVINTVGVGKATQQGFLQATQSFDKTEHVLIDAFTIAQFPKTKQTPIIKGDQKSISIAAASIIAKEYRDDVMQTIHKEIPEYDWDKNVGYGTQAHRNAIKTKGLCKHHRTSYDLSKWL